MKNHLLKFTILFGGFFLFLLLTFFIFGVLPQEGFLALYDGALGDKYGVARTLVRATPLMLCGLGMVIAWKSGMYNIGGEGQFVIGGLTGAWLAKLLVGMTPGLLSPLILLASVFGGAVFALIAGWLQVKRGVQVVISTILLNFVALQILGWAVMEPLQEEKGQVFKTDALPNDVMLMRFDPTTDFHSGFFIAVFAVVLVTVWLYYTKQGFLSRVIGTNEKVARTNLVNVGKVQMLSMALSGGLCGLAGGIEYTGLIGWIGVGFSQNYGFISIPVALLGSLNPVGTGFSALWFGALYAGSEELKATTLLGNTLVPMLQAVAVLGYIVLMKWKPFGKKVASD